MHGDSLKQTVTHDRSLTLIVVMVNIAQKVEGAPKPDSNDIEAEVVLVTRLRVHVN